MNIKTIMAAMIAAACAWAHAMPTNEAIAKAGAEVQARLMGQLAKWQSGEMSDADMAKLLLVLADKEKEEAMHYVCLQGALAAFARAGDADAAVKALGRLRAETKDFTPEIEKSVVERAVATADAQVAAKIRANGAEDLATRRAREMAELRQGIKKAKSLDRKAELVATLRLMERNAAYTLADAEKELKLLMARSEGLNEGLKKGYEKARSEAEFNKKYQREDGTLSPAGECLANRKQLETACEQWQMETGKKGAPKMSDLIGRDKYVRNEPKCPCGGTYGFSVGESGEIVVTCSYGDDDRHFRKIPAKEDPCSRMDREIRELEEEFAHEISSERKLELSCIIEDMKTHKVCGSVCTRAEAELLEKSKNDFRQNFKKDQRLMQPVSEAAANGKVIVMKQYITTPASRDYKGWAYAMPLTNGLTAQEAVRAAGLKIPDGKATVRVFRFGKDGRDAKYDIVLSGNAPSSKIRFVSYDGQDAATGSEGEMDYKDFHLCAGDLILQYNPAAESLILRSLYVLLAQGIMLHADRDSAEKFGRLAVISEFLSRLEDIGTDSEKECAMANVKWSSEVAKVCGKLRTQDEVYRKDQCIANMKQIESACKQWVQSGNAGKVPTMEDLVGSDKYIKTMLRCPSHGRYAIAVGTNGVPKVTCSYGKNVKHGKHPPYPGIPHEMPDSQE